MDDINEIAPLSPAIIAIVEDINEIRDLGCLESSF